VPYGGGGPMAKFDAIIGQYNASGELFRIEGHCQSSCTMFLAIRNVCVDANASLLFHASLSARERDHAPYPEKNAHMASHYNSGLRAFVLANHYMDSFTFHAISGRDIIGKFGYRQCPGK
jgi:cytochrome oxidase Cu insertion factor (SCO1/SenC/PrrC family)